METLRVVVYRSKKRESIARVKKMGLSNLPAKVINGCLTFSSIIPSKKELISEVEKHL